MNHRLTSRVRRSAFTLIETLVVIAVIAILAVMLLPSIEKARSRSKQAACMSQLRQIGMGFHAFKGEHDDKLPSGVSVQSGGVKEFFTTPLGGLRLDWPDNVYRIFQSLSNYLDNPRVLICPGDKIRRPAESYAKLKAENVSYFALVCIPGECETPESVWAGDAVLTNFAAYSSESVFGVHSWSMHGGSRGNHLFADGHVESIGTEGKGIGVSGNGLLIAKPSERSTPMITDPGASGRPSSGGGSSGIAMSGGGGSSASASSTGPSGGGGSGGSALALLDRALGGNPGQQGASLSGSRQPSLLTVAPQARDLPAEPQYVSSTSSLSTNFRPRTLAEMAAGYTNRPPPRPPPAPAADLEPVVATAAPEVPDPARNWSWLLLIAVIVVGAATGEMYRRAKRRHPDKKLAVPQP